MWTKGRRGCLEQPANDCVSIWLTVALAAPPSFNVAETSMNECPVCGKEAELHCKCPLGDSICPEGHEWHRCLLHDKVLIGPSDHSKGTMDCHCEDKPTCKS